MNVGKCNAFAHAHQAGVRYLLSRQQEDGGWQDYHTLPVGTATEWVTAFVAATLFDAGGPDALQGARRAAARLAEMRPICDGWGYNAATGPDADSTAWALITLQRAGLAPPASAVAFLMSLRRGDGGVATYPRSDGWGISHPDVTPVAFLALPKQERSAVAADTVKFILRSVDADGCWPAYWWRGRHYSTYWNRMALLVLGRNGKSFAGIKSARPSEPMCTVETAFDLAWVLALAVLDEDPPGVVNALAQLLMERQRSDGGWPGGADLRVTSPSCRNPWTHPIGKLYEDDAGLITTSSAVRALALALGLANHSNTDSV